MTENNTKISEIAIIGAGPAGLMAAESLAKTLAEQANIVIYDQMPSAARKFLMAGRGGLNLTHSKPVPEFLPAYGNAAPRLAAALEAFSPGDVRQWAENLGEPTFVGSSGRIFPKSFKASPLLRAWLRRLEHLGVKLAPRHRWTGWEGADLVFETADGRHKVTPAAAILALGGASWAKLGSDGRWAEIFGANGIDLARFQPVNCGFDLNWSEIFVEKFAGTPLKSILFSTKSTFLRGEALITAHGLEGNAIYALSTELRDDISRDGHAILHLDLRPDITLERLQARLEAPPAGASTSNFLRKAAGLQPVHLGVLREVFGRDLPVSAAARARAIKRLPLRLVATRPIDRAISTAGGVKWDELDAHLMLKKRPGTFIAGEMLDFEAPTGGYLLQGAFSTGMLAAQGVMKWLGSAAEPAK